MKKRMDPGNPWVDVGCGGRLMLGMIKRRLLSPLLAPGGVSTVLDYIWQYFHQVAALNVLSCPSSDFYLANLLAGAPAVLQKSNDGDSCQTITN